MVTVQVRYIVHDVDAAVGFYTKQTARKRSIMDSADISVRRQPAIVPSRGRARPLLERLF
jgi:hypothetical protein